MKFHTYDIYQRCIASLLDDHLSSWKTLLCHPRYTTTDFLINPQNAISIPHWKVAPVLINPKGIFLFSRVTILCEMLFLFGHNGRLVFSCTLKKHQAMITFFNPRHTEGFALLEEHDNYIFVMLISDSKSQCTIEPLHSFFLLEPSCLSI